MTIDIGRIGIWSAALEAHSSSRAREAAQELEAMGYPVLWINEATGRDPFVLATLLLSATSTLKLATGIANIYARDPMTMAGCQKTLAEAFPGRFLLGLGVSHPSLVERLRKHSYDKPLAYMKAYLAAMDDSMFNAVGPAGDPGRVLAALGPKMLEPSATQADGAHPYFTTPEHTATPERSSAPTRCSRPSRWWCSRPTPPRPVRWPGGHGRSTCGPPATWTTFPGWASTRTGRPTAAPTGSSTPSSPGARRQVADGCAEHHDAGADHVCVQVLRADRELPLAEWRALAPALL